MDVALIVAMQVTLLGASVAAAVFWVKRTRKRWRDSLAGDPDVVDAIESRMDGLTLRTRRAPHVRCQLAGGGKNNPPIWLLQSSVGRLAARTTLAVSEEGIFGALREAVGWKDVQLGRGGLDARFTIRGSDPDVIRAVLLAPEVTDALRALFDGGARSLRVLEGGAVSVVAARHSREPSEAKARTLELQALVNALNRYADEPAKPEVLSLEAGGSSLASASGGASGAPVPVPLKVR